MVTTTVTKYKQDLRCTHRVYAFLQKCFWDCDEIQGYENAKGKDKAMGCITASVEVSLHSLAAPNNADLLCKKLKVKPYT